MRPGQGRDRDQRAGNDRGPDRPDWTHLGRVVRDRRTELGLTQAEVHGGGGPSPATLYLIETGGRDTYRPQVLRRLERALHWRAGSVRRVLAGGEPVPDGEDPTAPPGGHDRAGVSEAQAWMSSFRRLPLSRHDKLLILSRLLEEVIGELGAGRTDEPPDAHRAFRP